MMGWLPPQSYAQRSGGHCLSSVPASWRPETLPSCCQPPQPDNSGSPAARRCRAHNRGGARSRPLSAAPSPAGTAFSTSPPFLRAPCVPTGAAAALARSSCCASGRLPCSWKGLKAQSLPIEASSHLAKPFRERQGDLEIKSPRARPGSRASAAQQPWIRCSRCEPDAGPAQTPSGAAAAAQRLAVDGERCNGRWRCIQPRAAARAHGCRRMCMRPCIGPNVPTPPPAPPQLASQLGAALQEAAAHANRDLLIAAAALLCAFGVPPYSLSQASATSSGPLG